MKNLRATDKSVICQLGEHSTCIYRYAVKDIYDVQYAKYQDVCVDKMFYRMSKQLAYNINSL